MACCSYGGVGESCCLEGLFPAAAFLWVVEWFFVECEDELVGFCVVFLYALVEFYPGVCGEGYESFSLLGFWWYEVVVSLDVCGL